MTELLTIMMELAKLGAAIIILVVFVWMLNNLDPSHKP